MSTPEHSQRIPVMITREYLKWSGVFWNDGTGKRNPDVRSRMALAQTLHPKSLKDCLQAGQTHITHRDAREVIFIFENLLPDTLDDWLANVKELGDGGDESVRIIAAAADLSARRREKEVICYQMREK